MKIVRLRSKNVLRLTAVDIAPAAEGLTIVGGRNGAGKSSVLDSIAMALGGAKLVPPEPIHGSEIEGIVVVDLDNGLTATRRFSRTLIHKDGCASLAFSVNEKAEREYGKCDCKPAFGETISTLFVSNKEGARYPSPQAVLDKMLGSLAFDPLAFALEGKQAGGTKRQGATLRALAGLDTSEIDARRKAAAERRAMKRQALALAEARALALPRHENAPKEPIPMDEVARDMARAQEYAKLAADAERAVDKERDRNSAIGQALNAADAQVLSLEEALKRALAVRDADQANLIESQRKLDAARITAEAARAVVPDIESFKARVGQIEAINEKVRANLAGADADAVAIAIAKEADAEDAEVRKADENRAAALAAARFPIDGLGVTDDGEPTFAGLPLSQASSAEQLRISTAIGLALNKGLNVMLIRSGNLLDEDSLAAIAAQAAAADAQVWIEWVTKDANQATVMIEDGAIAK